MDGPMRRGARFYGLSMLAFLIPGLVGFILGKALSWPSVAQSAMFALGSAALLLILFVLDTVVTGHLAKPLWGLWAVAVVGAFAAVAIWVAADKSSGGSTALKAVSAVVVLVTCVAPVALVSQRLRGDAAATAPTVPTGA